jgi:hypothetical protein
LLTQDKTITSSQLRSSAKLATRNQQEPKMEVKGNICQTYSKC